MPAKSNESLASRLQKAEVFDEFCTLMFGQGVKYEDLLEQLEKWGISSSLAGLNRFSDSHRSAWTLERARAMAAEQLNNTELDDAQRKVVAERLFNLAASPAISDKTLLKMRDQEIKLATVRQNDEKLRQNERRLAQQDELIEMQRRKIEALEAQAKQAAEKLDELRDPAKADDPAMRQRILDEVDRAMGIKKS